MEILKHGIRFALSTDMFEGELLTGRLNREGLQLTCWAKNLATGSFVEDFLVQTCDGDNVDAKVICINNEIDRTCTCSIDVPLSAIPHPYVAIFNVFAISMEEKIAFLLPRSQVYDLDKFSIKTVSDFSRLIQTPATRIKDEHQLLYASTHVLERFPDNLWVIAGSACIIGYRLIHKFSTDVPLLDSFIFARDRALHLSGTLPPGHNMRWMISLHLISAYVHLFNKKFDCAVIELEKIIDYADLLHVWPSSLTNVLLANYGLAYLSLIESNKDRAHEIWTRSDDIFRAGCAAAQFPNSYSYGELENALKVTRESFIGRQVALSAFSNSPYE